MKCPLRIGSAWGSAGGSGPGEAARGAPRERMGLGERQTNRITTRERPTNRITTRERPTNRITTRDDDGWTYSECMKYACSYPDMSAKVHAHMLAPAAHASTYYDPYLFKAHAHAFTHRVRMIAMCVYDCSHCGKPKRERKSKKRTARRRKGTA